MKTLAKLAITAIIATSGLYAIGIAAGFIISQFMTTSDAIDDATDSLKEFQNLQGNMDGGIGSSAIYQFRPGASSNKTIINAESVPEGKRVMRKKRFDDYHITQ